MSKQITIDDGTREYEIVNTYGKTIAVVHFRPGDISLADRYQTMRDSFSEIVKPLADIDINPDGTADGDAGIEAIRKADKAFRDKLNELLDSDDAGEIFKSRNPFSSVGGRFFCEGVLDALGGIIGDVMAEEAEASLKRTSKYIETES